MSIEHTVHVLILARKSQPAHPDSWLLTLGSTSVNHPMLHCPCKAPPGSEEKTFKPLKPPGGGSIYGLELHVPGPLPECPPLGVGHREST